jgi:hypothetical protein
MSRWGRPKNTKVNEFLLIVGGWALRFGCANQRFAARAIDTDEGRPNSQKVWEINSADDV